MKLEGLSLTLEDIARLACVETPDTVDSTISIDGVQDLREADGKDLSFLADESYLKYLEASRARVILISPELREKVPETGNRVFLVSEDPFASFIGVAEHFYEKYRDTYYPPGVHESAVIAKSVELSKDIHIGPLVTIGENTVVGEGVIIESSSVIGSNCRIGKRSHIRKRAVLEDQTQLGEECVINAGAVIGSDGLGYIKRDNKYCKIPHLGKAVLGDQVEIGANTAVDKGTLLKTSIGSGTKVDNLVQIAHNVTVGEDCVICGLCGISGSTEVGDRVTIAGQCGTKGHVKIGSDTTLCARTGVSKNIPSGVTVKGYPPKPLKDFLKHKVMIEKLPSYVKRLENIEKKV